MFIFESKSVGDWDSQPKGRKMRLLLFSPLPTHRLDCLCHQSCGFMKETETCVSMKMRFVKSQLNRFFFLCLTHIWSADAVRKKFSNYSCHAVQVESRDVALKIIVVEKMMIFFFCTIKWYERPCVLFLKNATICLSANVICGCLMYCGARGQISSQVSCRHECKKSTCDADVALCAQEFLKTQCFMTQKKA